MIAQVFRQIVMFFITTLFVEYSFRLHSRTFHTEIGEKGVFTDWDRQQVSIYSLRRLNKVECWLLMPFIEQERRCRLKQYAAC